MEAEKYWHGRIESTIRKSIREYRLRNRLTQAEFSHICGVSTATVSRWENDCDTMSLKQLYMVLTALGMDLTTLDKKSKEVDHG